MTQPRNPNDKTFPKTFHLRISVLEKLERMSGAIGLSHGEVVTDALLDWFEKQEALRLSLNRAAEKCGKERDARRKRKW